MGGYQGKGAWADVLVLQMLFGKVSEVVASALAEGGEGLGRHRAWIFVVKTSREFRLLIVLLPVVVILEARDKVEESY